MATQWFVTRDGKKAHGPLSMNRLKMLAASGQLRPSDHVRQEGTAFWIPAREVEGLFPSLLPHDR